jgi:serine/threonine protein kinase
MAIDSAQAKSLFLAASDLTDPAERAVFLDRECGGDAELRARVEGLLRANDDAPLPASGPKDATGDFAPDEPAELPTADWPGKGERVGAVLGGKYKLVEEIGAGGMGSVYLAQQTEAVRRAVAVKVIKAGMDSRAVLARFEAERQALALMDHPNIAKVLDAGTTEGGRPFFVMELVKGVPITEFCDARQLTPRERLELFVPVCEAIQHAHQKGIIHRDLKPSNVLVALYDDRAVPKVIDFGVAKAAGQPLTDQTLLTGFGAVVGTPEYMSPEQASLNNLDIDTRSDVYALGVLLYELLTGSTPVDRKRLGQAALLEVLRVVREVEAPRPSARLSTLDTRASVAANRGTEPAQLSRLLRGELDWVVLKALEKDRTRRYETANGLARDIQRYLADEVVEARPPSRAYRLQKFVRRHRPQVLAAGLVLLALLAGMIGTTLGLVQAHRAAQAERIARNDAEQQQTLAEQAAAQERQAKGREAQRAQGEQKAKLEAQAKRQEAERNLAFARKGNAILGSVFAGLDPKQIVESGRPLQDVLRQNLSRAVKELEGSAIGEPLEVAQMQNTLGLSLLGLGEAGLAVEVFQKALGTRKAQLGPDHPDTLQLMNDLALAYKACGQLAKAVPLYEEALQKAKVKLGPDHPDTLTCMDNLAGAYQASGQLTRALPLLEEALEKTKVKLGPDHPHTLTTMSNLATAYQASGQLARAVPLYEQTMERLKAKLGPDHPDTLTSMNNLAGAYQASGQLAKAVPLYEETLQKQKAKLGPNHPHTLLSMNNLAMAYQESGQLAEAVPLQEDTLEKTKVKLGLDHPLTLVSMNNLAMAYQASGQLAKAVSLFEETLEKRKAKLEPDHPDTLLSMHNLAWAYRASSQLARAVPLYEEALEKMKAKLGPDHPYTLACMNNLGKAYAEARQGAKAATTLVAFVDASRKRAPKDSPQFAGLLALLSLDLLGCGQHAAAEPLLRECLAIREKTQPDAWTTFNTMSMLGGALLAQKKYTDAEPLLLKGYQGMKAREKAIPKQAKTRLPEALD